MLTRHKTTVQPTKVQEVQSEKVSSQRLLSLWIHFDGMTFSSLTHELTTLNLESHLDDVLSVIRGDDWLGASRWSVAEVTKWILSLPFLRPNNEQIAQILANECVDGEVLTRDIVHMSNEWKRWNLNSLHFFLLSKVIDTWSRPREFIMEDSSPHTGVVTGTMADLSMCSLELTQALMKADELCMQRAEGYIYGQLVVLGHKQWTDDNGDGEMIASDCPYPVGWSNERFVLRRRKIPNGIKPFLSLSSSSSNISHSISIKGAGELHTHEVTFRYVTDPSRDVYQIGRADVGNDWTVKGPLHFSRSYPCTSIGPVSRYACRIECERLPPYRVFLFAAGFNEENNLALGGSAPVWLDQQTTDDDTRWQSFDALTTFGVRLWRPDTKEWVEISVRGRCHTMRDSPDQPGMLLSPSYYTNELIEGSVIDLCGVSFVFQSPTTMATNLRRQVEPLEVIRSLNALKPQCPVHLSGITFTHLSDGERMQRAIDKAERSGNRPITYP